MINLILDTTTHDTLSRFLLEGISLPISDRSKENIDKISISLSKIINSQVRKSTSDETIKNSLESFKEVYQQALKSDPDILVLLHLNLLGLLNELENESEYLQDSYFKEIWVNLSYDIIAISLAKNTL